MEIINSNKVPAAIGPYSQAIRTGSILFCSGQLGIHPETKQMAGPDVQAQIIQVMKNIRELLKSQGLDLNHIVKTTLFLADMNDFPEVNRLYAEALGNHKPARSTIQVARLPLDGRIEIECIAIYPD